jgi:hypothetical protein
MKRLTLAGLVLGLFIAGLVVVQGCGAPPYFVISKATAPLSNYGQFDIVVDNDSFINNRMKARSDADAARYTEIARQAGDMIKGHLQTYFAENWKGGSRKATLRLELMDYSGGSGALRFFVGAGAGNGHVSYEARIIDGNSTVASFSVKAIISGETFGADKYFAFNPCGHYIRQFFEDNQ